MKRSGILLALILLGALGISAPRAQQDPGGATQAAQCDPGAGCGIRLAAREKARKSKTSKQAQPAASTQEQKKPPERTTYDEQDREAAVIPGLPGVRFWADSLGSFADALPRDKGTWLILSSGGSSGAYGAGVLVGLSQVGKRPEFSVVTGVSIGAVMAPYAFLGAKYDDQLRDSFLDLTSADVFEDAVRADSLVDTWPLKNSLAKRVTPELLADVAAEHHKGRRLFVVTADLDSERPVIWNMGAIAAHGTDAALKLFRDVLLAASAIPGVFPPVYIDAEAQDRKFQEMHADGGVFGPFFVAPPSWLIEGASEQLPTDKLYVIIHSKLVPEFDVTGPEKIFILGRTISAAVKAGAQAELALLSAAAKRDGIELNVAYVDGSFRQPAQTAFDQKQMTALFNFGLEQAKNGTAFRTQNPAGQAQTK
ncbi:MAG: patatin-like phospholipase family protein [Xanthobacteraceae bacterium]